MSNISQNLKLLRKQYNLTQDELALKINNERHNVAAWETNRAKPDVDTIQKLSNFFNIPLHDLINGVLDENYFNKVEEPPIPITNIGHSSCLKMIEFLEGEIKEKNQTIRALLQLMKENEKL